MNDRLREKRVWMSHGPTTTRRSRRRAAFVLVPCLAAGFVSTSEAATIGREDFETYNTDATGSPGSDSDLTGNTGGTGFSAAWVTTSSTAAPTVVSTVAAPLSFSVKNANGTTVGTVAGGSRALQFTNQTAQPSSGTTAGRAFTTASTAESVWARFLVRFDAGSVEQSDFLTMYFGNAVANPNFNLIGNGTAGAGDFTIRDGGTGRGVGGTDITANDIGVTNYLVVARVTKTTGTSYNLIEGWVNPILDANNNLPLPMMSGTISGSTLTSITSVGIRHANLDATDVVLMDEILYGTTPGDVVPGATGALPEPSAVSLLGLAAVGLLKRRARPSRPL